jgi:glycosyltransferase involved in cell wall biosynthesis
MRFHVVALPHTQTTRYYMPCAYTQKVRRFCDMMHGLGHEVFLYASEDNEAACTEFITIVPKADQQKWWGDDDQPSGYPKFDWDVKSTHWVVTNGRAIAEIGMRRQEGDFICIIGGTCQKMIGDAFPDLTTVEYGIGYSGVFAQYRVYESYAWMHAVAGAHTSVHGIMSATGRFFDAVIPNYYDVDEFPYSAEKDDYFLYIGRLIDSKGWQIAVETCRRLGKRLVIAGKGEKLPEYGEYVGVVDWRKRGELMSRAQAVFVPTLYLEPFGGVHAEAMLCGTPVITSDWGVFPETVRNGFNGYRCRSMREFVDAAENVSKLDTQAIRDYAISRFSTDVVAVEYERYFKRLQTIPDGGFLAK